MYTGITQAQVDANTLKSSILSQLSQLDLIISREGEDTYTDMGKVPSYASRASAMIQKAALRAQLEAV